jgi:hypothetical protein
VPLVRHLEEGGHRRRARLLFLLGTLGGKRIVELAAIRPSFPSFGQPDLRVRPQAQRRFFTIDAVLAVSEFAAGRRDDQVQAIAIKQLALLVGRSGVLDFLDRQQLGVFSGWGYFVHPDIPPGKCVQAGYDEISRDMLLLNGFP